MIESIGQMGRAGPRLFMHQRLLTWTAGVMILLAATSACAIHLPCKLLVAEPPRPFHPGPGDVISYDVTVDAGYADGHYQYFRTGTNGVGTIVIDTILSSVPVAAPGYRFEYLARPGSLIVPIGPLPAGAYTVTSTVRYYDVASASLYDACPPLSRTLTVYAESGPTVVAPVVEYHNATLDRHFMTQFAFEIEKLDASADWKRTGEAFLAYRPDLSDGRGTAIIRLYGMPAAGLDAHFWSWDYVELNTLWQWMHETDDAFELPIPDIATGLCRRGLLPVYRLWNGRADADHRYTTSVETRQALIDAGWCPRATERKASRCARCSKLCFGSRPCKRRRIDEQCGAASLRSRERRTMSLATLPLWPSFILVVVLPTALAVGGTVVVRRRTRLKQLTDNNEVAGFKFAVVGVIYAVLLAFAVFVVWEQLTAAESDVVREAGSAVNLYRLAGGMEAQSERNVRTLVTRYLETAIADDWPAMEGGSGSATATQALNALYAGVLGYRPVDGRQEAILAAALHELSELTEARRERLLKAATVVPGVIWFGLISGGFITIAFTWFFGTRNLGAQMLMTGGLSLIVCSGLLIILAVDHPFGGAVRVHPDVLVKVLEDFGHEAAPAK